MPDIEPGYIPPSTDKPTPFPVRKNLSEDPKPKVEPLTGEETAKVIAEMYDILGPTNGCILVNPNTVLAVAGLKGNADLPSPLLNDEEAEKIDMLNRQMESHGVHLGYPRNYRERLVTQLSFESLRGIEYKSRQTKLPGYFPYDSGTGRQGLREWQMRVQRNIRKINRDGRLSDETVGIYDDGVRLGYPDQAIRDFADWYEEGTQDHSKLTEADILSVNTYAQQYKGNVPEFDYYPSSAENPEIQEYIRKARETLDGFYKSEWHIKTAQDPSFLAARKERDERHERNVAHLQTEREQKRQ
ncbi:MAG: hypothetical protein HY429_03585 [Candidatus Levybacteria bacterium]|nr:hypothetical protein [Candidatus Levybacteria bacterium]